MDLRIFDICIGLLANGLRVYITKRFVEVFFDKKDYRWRLQNVLYIIFWLGTSLIYNLYHTPLYNVIANVTALFLVIIPYKANVLKKIFTVLLIYGITAIADSLVIVTFTKYAIGDDVKQIYECITSLVLLLVVFTFERTRPAGKNIALPLCYQLALGVVPIISIGVIYFVVRSASEMKVMIISVIVGLFFVNVLIFYLYHSLSEFYLAYLENRMFEQMVGIYANQLETMQESQDRVKALRHDLRHHIIELKSMAKEDGDAKMHTYIEDMEKFMLNPREYVTTGNQNVDGVLNYLLQKANETLKVVDVKINIPERLQLDDFKICAILGNLLDNAIKAASETEEKYVGINIRAKQGVLFIFIKNSYCGNIVKADSKIVTSQKKTDIHGIGLENVRKIVEMNGGEMKINYCSNRFEAEILLYLSEIQ